MPSSDDKSGNADAARSSALPQRSTTPTRSSVLFKLLALGFMIFVAIAYTLGMSQFFPFDQDEVLQHHALACAYYPLNSLNNSFPAGCDLWNLRIPGTRTFLPLRSYLHVGVFQSILYFPLFLVWKHPYSARLFGILLIAAQAYMLSRVYRKNAPLIFVGMLCILPYAYHHLIDIGHLTVHTTIICLFQMMLFKLQSSSSRRADVAMCGAIGLILALGVHVRLSFLFLLPACALQLAVFLSGKFLALKQEGVRLTKSLFDVSLMALTCAAFALVPTLVLLNSWDTHAAPYYMVMFANSSAEHATNFEAIRTKVGEMGGYILEPLRTAHILMNRYNSSYWAHTLYVQGAITFFLLSIVLAPSWKKRGWIALNLACGFISLIAICTSSKSYGAHNVTPCLVFAISAAVAAFPSSTDKGRLWRSCLLAIPLVAFLSSNVYSYKELIARSSGVSRPYHHNLVQLFEFVNQNYARSHLTVGLDWNTYYTKSLYGPREQAVLCLDGLSGGHFIKVKEIGKQLGRDTIFIANHPSEEKLRDIRQAFPDLHQVQVPFDVGAWQLWEGSAGS